jgi:hypothetical protein
MKLQTVHQSYQIQKLSAEQLEKLKIVLPAMTHHILIVDRSSSMHQDLENLKSSILDMFRNVSESRLNISLISYSGLGDVKLHFSKMSYQDVFNSEILQSDIKKLQATDLTSVSQSLALALSMTDSKEGTCITLHTDGWPNDPSAYQEEVAIDQLLQEIQSEYTNLIINTIAHHAKADLNLLKKIANVTKGRNVIVETEDQLKAELSLITSKCLESIQNADLPKIQLQCGKGEYLVAKNDEILGGTRQKFFIPFSNDLVVYLYQIISASDYQALPEEYPTNEEKLMFARTLYQLGNLFEARNVLKESGHRNLYARFKNVIEPKDIMIAVDHIDAVLFNRKPKYQLENIFGQKPHCSLFELLDQLKKNKAEIDLNHMLKNYKKRSINRLQGSYTEEGQFISCRYQTHTKSTSTEWKRIAHYSVNRHSAALNLEIVEEMDLIDTQTNEIIHEVAGIPMHIKEFRSYAMINDEYCMKSIIIRIQNQKQVQFDEKTGLQADWIEGDYALYEINLKEAMVTHQAVKFDHQVAKKLMEFAVIHKFLGAILKQSNTTPYSEQQIEALKQYDISPHLNFSPSTVNPYLDLKTAISEGIIDSYTSKKMHFGSIQYGILGTDQLYSANAYLERRFTYGEEKKPTLDRLMSADFNRDLLGIKTLSSRTKLNQVDGFSYPIYEELLGFKQANRLNEILGPVLTKKILQAIQNKNIASLVAVKNDIEDHMDDFYHETICPLVFAIGIAGSIEALNLGFESYQADEIQKQFGIKLDPKEHLGFFYVKDDMMISVVPTTEYYSVESIESTH